MSFGFGFENRVVDYTSNIDFVFEKLHIGYKRKIGFDFEKLAFGYRFLLSFVNNPSVTLSASVIVPPIQLAAFLSTQATTQAEIVCPSTDWRVHANDNRANQDASF